MLVSHTICRNMLVHLLPEHSLFFRYCCYLHFFSSFLFFLWQSSVYIFVFFNYVICASCTVVEGRHFSRTKKKMLSVVRLTEVGKKQVFFFRDVVDLEKGLEVVCD